MEKKNENGRLLFIVDSFPPDRGGRVEKIVRRVKYLLAHGWQIELLAPKSEHLDSKEEETLPYKSNLHVTRTNYLLRKKFPSLRHNKNRNPAINQSQEGSLLDFLFVPKGFVRWFPYAVINGIRLARKCDVVLSINNPIMLHLIGLIVSKITRKPWVVELRDPISGYAYSRRGPEKLNSWLEKLIFHSADKIIRFEDSMPIGVAERYPHLESSRFVSIPYMGYEKEDFQEFHTLKANDYKDTLKVVYTGSFYGDTITPIPFLKSLHNFFKANPTAKQEIEVIFAGDWSEAYDDEITQLDIAQNVRYLGYLSRQECLTLWNESHVQLLILGNEEDNINRIPSKFYDYVGSKRPIFALVHPKGKVAQIVKDEQLGFVADSEHVSAITEQIALMHGQFKQGELGISQASKFREEITSDNSERVIAEILADVI